MIDEDRNIELEKSQGFFSSMLLLETFIFAIYFSAEEVSSEIIFVIFYYFSALIIPAVFILIFWVKGKKSSWEFRGWKIGIGLNVALWPLMIIFHVVRMV